MKLVMAVVGLLLDANHPDVLKNILHTVAHEIGHTLVYDTILLPPKMVIPVYLHKR